MMKMAYYLRVRIFYLMVFLIWRKSPSSSDGELVYRFEKDVINPQAFSLSEDIQDPYALEPSYQHGAFSL
ncbi:hypothetical protein IC611_01855 [Proteus mirabilis]